MSTNRRVILAERPRYIMPTASCFRMDEGPMPPEPQEGEVRVRTLWLAMESTLYSKVQRITQLQRDPVKLKDPMVGSAVGRVDRRIGVRPRFSFRLIGV